jgi:putative glutamine amidotransferase
MSPRPRIAIPVPLSGNPEYVERSLPQYEHAIEQADGEAVRIPLDLSPADTMKIVERCDAVLLPGASADVDPAKYGAARHEKTAPADTKRDTVDELLLQDAYNMRKPILGICYGLQILNVYRTGTLVQHIESQINHEAGRKAPIAHAIDIDPSSRLFRIVSEAHERALDTGAARRDCSGEPHASDAGSGAEKHRTLANGSNSFPVNSSHHQSADVVGDGLRVVARCREDGVIEALEGTNPDHFVLGVQWHPERSVDADEPSRAIFRAFVEAAAVTHRKLAGEFEGIR